MSKIILFLLYSTFPTVILSKDALQYFIKNKNVKSFTLTLLNENSNISKHWFEYKYKFETNNDLNVQKNQLKVGIVLEETNKFDCRESTHNASILKGYSIDIINWIEQSLNLSVEYTIINKTKDISSYLNSNEVDIVACHITLPERKYEILNLYPSLKSKHILIYKPLKLNFTKDIFILTFAGSLWLVFLIALIVLAVCLRVSTTRYSMLHPKYDPWTWVEITLWSIAAACQQGLSHTPYGFASCLIFLIGYIMSYLLYTGFAAAITSVLLQYDIYYKLDVGNLKTYELKLICYEDSEEFSRKLNGKFVKTIYTNDFSTIFKFLDYDNTLALAPGILANQYLANNLGYNEVSKYKTSTLSDFNYIKGFSILRNNSLREQINIQLLRMEEKGILANMLIRNLKPVPASNINYGYSSAGLEHVGSAILILLAGILTSIIFLSAEFMLAFYKKNESQT